MLYRTAPLVLTTFAAVSPKASLAFSPVVRARTVSTATRTAHQHLRHSLLSRAMSSPSTNDSTPLVIRGRPTWQQTMIRIADPAKTLPFYTNVLGMTHIDTLDFPQWNFSIYFVATLPEGETYTLKPGTQAAHDYLWSMEGVALELTHNHGTESPDDDFKGYHPGNAEKDGFGHVAVSCDDVYAACEYLEDKGVAFKKRPDEGRMKGLAFAYDPDRYWVEVVRRRTAGQISNKFNFSQTMLRVKDPKKSIEFYKRLGMKVMAEKHFPEAKFSLYFLASNVPDADVPTDPTSEEAALAASNLFQPVLGM